MQCILKGHGLLFCMFSMGGAIAVHTASLKLIPFLVGLVVIDVVEGGKCICVYLSTLIIWLFVGSAMSALSSMQGVLGDRPKSFESLEKAIEWR